MKAKVDKELCIGCGLCPNLSPKVFEMDGDIAIVIVESVPAGAEASCEEAVENCPVEAITII